MVDIVTRTRTSSRLRRPHRKFFQDEGRIGRFINSGLGGTRHAECSLS